MSGIREGGESKATWHVWGVCSVWGDVRRKKRASERDYLKGWNEIAQGNTEHQAWPQYSFSTLVLRSVCDSLPKPSGPLSPIPTQHIVIPSPRPTHTHPHTNLSITYASLASEPTLLYLRSLKRSQLPFSLFSRFKADIFPFSSEWPRTPSSNHTETPGGGRLLNGSPPLGIKVLSCLHMKERVKYLWVPRRPNMRWGGRKGIIVLKFSLSFSASLTVDSHCVRCVQLCDSYCLVSRLIWYGELYLNMERIYLCSPIVDQKKKKKTQMHF